MKKNLLACTLGLTAVFALFGVACGADNGESSASDSSVDTSVDSSAPETYETFAAKDLFPWIGTLTADNVTSLKQEYGGSCMPGSFATVKTSAEESEIASILAYLDRLTFTEISDGEGQVEGGGGTHLTITTAENTYTLYEYSKILYLDGQYYRYSEYIPTFTTGGTCFCFANLYGDSVLYVNGVETKNYGNLADELLFEEKDDAVGFTYTGYELKFDGGTIVISDEKTFAFSLYDDTQREIYTIVGETDFSQIFTDYPLST